MKCDTIKGAYAQKRLLWAGKTAFYNNSRFADGWQGVPRRFHRPEGEKDMICITGDTHGGLERFKGKQLRGLGKGDVLIVLGDFGFVWDGGREEQARLDWLAKRPYTILFLDGTHENFDLLDALPVEERFGGRVQPLRENIFHVCRGSILELEGLSFLCFGGGESPDKDDRDPGVNWWPREMPSDEEYAFCDANAAAHGYRVQYVLTHDAPSRFLDFTILPAGANNRLHAYFDKLVGQMSYDQWLFGCYHRYTRLSPKVRCLFEDVVPVGERKKWWKRL